MLKTYIPEKTILIVDDDVINCRYHEVLAKSLGYQDVVSAHNGLEAVGAFAQNLELIDVILMDVNMPKMGGIEATRLIRSLRANVPVVFITSNDISELKMVIEAEFYNSFVLRKPISLEQLHETLSIVLPKLPMSMKKPDFSMLFEPILTMVPSVQ